MSDGEESLKEKHVFGSCRELFQMRASGDAPSSLERCNSGILVVPAIDT
jgi:hypothetical protein